MMKIVGKNLLRIFIVLFSMSADFVNSQSDASAYLSSLGEEFRKISEDMMSYISAANHGKSARKVDKRRQEVISQLKQSERSVRMIKPFEGNSALRDSTVNYLRISLIVMTNDYGKIMDLEDIAEQSYDAMEAYFLAKKIAEEKIGKAYDAMDVEFDAFATTHNIKIAGESKLSKKLSIANEVNSYYQDMYLIFFKSYKNEAYLIDAMSRYNVGAIEQSRNALLNSASGDLPKLGPMPNYGGDVTLKRSLQELLGFYKTEAADKIPVVIDFFLAKEKFEKLKKVIDSKKPNERTKEDIDSYNKAVNDLNVKLNATNQINDDLNKRRSLLLKNWNEASEAFLDRYTP